MPHETRLLRPEQFLLMTLMAKLAIVAVLSTMLVRFPWFRRILLTEKRDWPERLVFAFSLGLPLTIGVLARLLLNYEAADVTLSENARCSCHYERRCRRDIACITGISVEAVVHAATRRLGLDATAARGHDA